MTQSSGWHDMGDGTLRPRASMHGKHKLSRFRRCRSRTDLGRYSGRAASYGGPSGVPTGAMPASSLLLTHFVRSKRLGDSTNTGLEEPLKLRAMMEELVDIPTGYRNNERYRRIVPHVLQSFRCVLRKSGYRKEEA